MIKISKLVRSFNLLLISICLVVTPVFGFVKPARASATVDGIAAVLSMTPENKQILQDAFNRINNASRRAECETDVLKIASSKNEVPRTFFSNCREEIRSIILAIAPYMESTVAKIVLPVEARDAYTALKAIYTTEFGRQLLENIDRYAVDTGSCVAYTASWAIFARKNPAGALTGTYFVGFLMECGEAMDPIIQLVDGALNRIAALIVTGSTSGWVDVTPKARQFCPANASYQGPACQSKQLNFCPSPNYSSASCIGWTGDPDPSNPSSPPTGGPSALPQCQPGANQVAVFANKYHMGACVVKGVGTYNDASAIGLPNNDIESLKLGSGASLQLCDNPNINSYCEWFNQDDSDLSNNTLNVNTVSSMKVMGTGSSAPSCEPGYSEVSLFTDNDYQGACVVKGIGTYNNPAELGIANDSVSSIKVGSGVKVRVCENDGNNSPCEIIDRNETRLTDNMINDNRISSAQVMSAGGVTLCSDTNYQGTCKTFDNGEVDNLADFGLSNNVSSIKVSSAHTLFMFSDLDQTGTPSSWNEDRPDLSVHSWDNFARSIRIERTNDTGCSFDPNANGIYLYRDGGFYPGGGCKLITGDISDLRPSTFDGFTGIKFMGSYKYSYKIKVYKDTNFNNFCGEYWLDQAWMAGPDCTRAQGGVVSLKLEPYTPPNQARNIVTSALRDSPDTQVVVDDSLDTQWVGGHKKPLGFVFESPKLIKSVVVFDRLQGPPSDNNQINKSKLVFSDGTVITDIDMGSGGARCAQVTFPAREYSWVNVVPDDASGNNGFREVQIWDTTGEVFSNTNCINKYTRTPVPGTGPAPTATWPTVTPPLAVAAAPANNATFPTSTTSVGLDFNTGDQFVVHVWGADYDYTTNWSTSTHVDVLGLKPGNYSWQVKSKNTAGEGAWSAVKNFTINTPPLVIGNGAVLDAGTTQSIQLIAHDREQGPLALDTSSLPSFATVTSNANGVANITLNPTASQAGTYSVSVTANDGQVVSDDVVNITVNGTGSSPNYQANYFNNRDMSGAPVLSRSEADINNDWGGGGPGGGVNNDNFSARWTKTSEFAPGHHKFTATGDDGLRLKIDGQVVIDKWIDQGATTYEVTVPFVAGGSHTVVYEYYENGGGAVAKLSHAQVAAPIPPPIGDYTFYKGINFNGNAVTIDGNVWQSMTAALGAGLSSPSGYQTANTSLVPNPAVNGDTNAMLNSAIWKQNAPLTLNQTIENADYQVYLWVMENYQSNVRKMNVKLEGTQVATNIGQLAKDGWVKYGPYNVTVSDGALSAELVNNQDSPHVMGMAIYKKASGSNSPQVPITSGNMYKLINPNSGKALDVNGGTAVDGTNVHI